MKIIGLTALSIETSQIDDVIGLFAGLLAPDFLPLCQF
jgi:hypothetical protein